MLLFVLRRLWQQCLKAAQHCYNNIDFRMNSITPVPFPSLERWGPCYLHLTAKWLWMEISCRVNRGKKVWNSCGEEGVKSTVFICLGNAQHVTVKADLRAKLFWPTKVTAACNSLLVEVLFVFASDLSCSHGQLSSLCRVKVSAAPFATLNISINPLWNGIWFVQYRCFYQSSLFCAAIW